MAGSNLVAQSSSVNRSAVADRARSAALRAWTKGSLRDLENAATRTLVRDCRLIRRRESWRREIEAYARAKVLRNLSQTDGCIGTNAWLFIVCGFGQVPQELAIDDAIRELGNHDQDRLYGLLSDKRCEVSKTGDLRVS